MDARLNGMFSIFHFLSRAFSQMIDIQRSAFLSQRDLVIVWRWRRRLTRVAECVLRFPSRFNSLLYHILYILYKLRVV